MATAPALDIVTQFILPNEVCMGLWQGPERGRWLEKIFVVRGDTIAKYVTDIGPAKNFVGVAVEIVPGDDETTVAEFRYEAERHRNSTFARDHMARVAYESTLVADVNRNREARRQYIKNRSVFGPFHVVQRNIYDSNPARRKIREATR
jgi:hypothetical protein